MVIAACSSSSSGTTSSKPSGSGSSSALTSSAPGITPTSILIGSHQPLRSDGDRSLQLELEWNNEQQALWLGLEFRAYLLRAGHHAHIHPHRQPSAAPI